MNCFSKRVFAWLIIFTFMFSISQGVYADESKISVPSSLEHLDANILNTYFAKLIEDKKETIIKSIEDENLTSLTIDGFNFDLSTGRVDLKLKAVYKVQYMSINYNSKLKADVTFKIITAEDYPKMGIYFMEVSGLSISDCPDAIDDILKKSLNKKLANKEIWPDNQQHADYIILKNDTLAEILTKRLTNEVANFHLTSIEKYLSGCKVNLGFKNTQCELFDITTGKISLNSDIFSNINLYTGDVYGSEKAGTLKLNLDLYIDSEDQSWWVKIDNSDIMLNGIDEKMNDFIRSNIQEYLSKKEIWINFADMSIHSLHASKPTPSIIPTPIVRPTPPSLETPTCVEQGADSVNNLNREDDPVILTGKDVGALEGIQPGDLVAWRYNNGWKQIPLQVDEKDYVDLMDIYNVNQYIRNLYENLGRKPVKILTYTDPDTFTGGDSDVTVDDNDEIVFMAKDAGQKADTNLSPSGVIADTCVEVKVYDADSADKTAYVYLFKQDGTLDPGAGKKYVKYNFNLLSGDYKTTYKTGGGPNFEDSTIITSNYACHFGDRWINDGMYIFNAKASGVNLLDRYKNLFAPGNPKRSEDTFCNGSAEGFPGEGCFIVNKSGPVRAIRSYMGANSGFYTQRQNIFYKSRQDITTYLRVHPISGVLDFFDYAPAAVGMKYYNNLNTAGVSIDGIPDDIKTGMIQWEMVNGDQGSIVMSHKMETDIQNLNYTSYYLDNKNPTDLQCTGDSYACGSSGLWLNSPLVNTDPSIEGAKRLELERRIYYKEPGITVQDAERLNSQANRPLSFAASRFYFTATSTSTPTPTSVSNDKMTISGFLRPDFTSDKMFIKSGFKVAVAGTNFVTETDSQGFFKIEGLPLITDSYSLEISKPFYLSRVIKDIPGNRGIILGTNTEPIEMWAGDIPINGAADNSINMMDIIEIAKTFNATGGEPKYNQNIDFNMDNTINILDIMIIAKHFNSTSANYPTITASISFTG